MGAKASDQSAKRVKVDMRDTSHNVRDLSASPLVSAVIPTHNRAVLLARAIQSVLRQTYPHIEIIVVDDASVDNTREIVQAIRDPRIRYVRHEVNRGGAAARNTGVRTATGAYIAFLDDDDEWEPEKTEEQLRVLQTYDVVKCTSNEAGDSLSSLSSRETLDLEDLRTGPWGGTGVLMAKTSVLREIPFDETLPRGQDWDLFIRIALKYRIAFLNKPLLRYDGGSHARITNSVRNVPIEELERQFRVVEKHKGLFGMAWFNQQMCQGLLYGLKDRRDKFSLLKYAVRRYGLGNVVSTLARRIRQRLVGVIKATTLVLRRRRRLTTP